MNLTSRNVHVVSILFIAWAACGCEYLRPTPDAPGRTGPAPAYESRGGYVPPAELVQKRLAIPPAPRTPALPRLVQQEPEAAVNRPASFRGTRDGILSKDARVVVIGRQSLVGTDSSAGKFVADLLYAAMQNRVELIDRDYHVLKAEEVQRIGDVTQAQDQEKLKGKFVLLTDKEKILIQFEGPPPTHMVIVHSVETPGNPVQVTLPWTIEDAEWTAYEQRVSGYRSAVAAHNQLVTAYLDAATKELKRDSSLQLDELLEIIERHPAVAEKRARESTLRGESESPARPMPYLAGRSPVAGGEWPEEIRRAAAMGPASNRPAPVQPEESAIFKSRQDVLGQFNHVPKHDVAAYQASVSVRVIEVASSKAVWFGLATTQNLNFAEGMAASCQEIAGRLLKAAE